MPAIPTWCRPAAKPGWTHAPFSGVVRDGVLYGRGACDMKGGIAAFVAGADRLPRRQPERAGQHQPADHRRRGRPGQGRHHQGARLDGGARRDPRHGAGRRADLPRRPRRPDQGRPARQHDGLHHPVRHPGAQRLSAAGRQPDPPAGPRAAPADRRTDRPGQRSSSRRRPCRSPASMSATPPTTSSPARPGRC